MHPIPELPKVREWLQADFGAEADRMLAICLSPADGRPLFLHHVALAQHAAGLDITPGQQEHLAAAYLYATATYFCVDAAFDGHDFEGPQDGVIVLPSDPVSFTAAVATHLDELASGDPSIAGKLHRSVLRALTTSAAALTEEGRFRSDPLNAFDAKAEFFHLWARSNSFLWLVEAAFILSGTEIPADLEASIQKMLYLLQLGDDVGDWRVDYERRNWTPFLRQCMTAHRRLLTIDELERHVYLSGALESELQLIADEIDEICARLGENRTTAPLGVALTERSGRAKQLLVGFKNDKQRHSARARELSDVVI